MTSSIKTHREGGVLTLTLARADKKNALTNAMYGALADAIDSASSGDIQVILIEADGDTFTAGNDLGEFAAQGADSNEERHVARFLKNLATTSVPVIAAVQGKAVGVGTTMLLHCDFVVLAEDAQLITPFVNLALIPEAASTYLLPLRVGYARAFEMFAFGKPVLAADAMKWGLANKVVPKESLGREAKQVADEIAAKPAGSISAMKTLMRESDKVLTQMRTESSIFSERLKSAEAREAFAAFAEKRKPDFAKVRSK
ncbi:enoyl-CoA hydratase-related protein [Cupriavidus numazuensis]|uniref:1,2-epoxyphenylacetyl-CoA isomerase n=1 Tax=Cupriavidus numazuensis TaxID=221992 RepID=A0ABN7Q9G5_9BURK|nr:enoyl-CoA hydratase-related protein [Cupriavidus numazuensis]CAG2158242.1 1,2-epoxyphenylacetyl-CoA isomerase [Cupriavidus numazuensis]